MALHIGEHQGYKLTEAAYKNTRFALAAEVRDILIHNPDPDVLTVTEQAVIAAYDAICTLSVAWNATYGTKYFR